MILRMSSLEQKWLIRILLKDLHLGLSHVKILNIFHEDANDLFDVTNNLQKVRFHFLNKKSIRRIKLETLENRNELY